MKKIIIIITSLLLLLFSDIKAQSFTVSGNTYSETKKERNIKEGNIQITPFKYQDSKGNSYPIYINVDSGRCYIVKVSQRTFKEYKQYMKPEMAKDVCKRVGVKWQEK